MDKVSVSRLEHPGSWAMDPSSCRFVAAFARALKARRVLEFGSGFSSLMLAREICQLEDNFLLSIDDAPQYTALAKEAFETSDCEARVDFRTAGLRPRLYGPRLLLSYSLPKGLLEALGPFDLVLIDAPHDDYGREAIFYDAFPAVAPGGYLVFDDANRSRMEKRYLKAWDAAYGDAIDPIMLEGIGNGLCVIEKVDEALPSYRKKGALGASLRTIRNYARFLLRSED